MNRLGPAMFATMAIAGNALAADAEMLMINHHCNMCHDADYRKAGPAFKEVAAKYRGNKGAAAMLERKVRQGGSGNWGDMPMPATARSVSDADIKIILQWVLSLK